MTVTWISSLAWELRFHKPQRRGFVQPGRFVVLHTLSFEVQLLRGMGSASGQQPGSWGK